MKKGKGEDSSKIHFLEVYLCCGITFNVNDCLNG